MLNSSGKTPSLLPGGLKRNLPAILVSIGLILLWQVVAMIINAHYILPSPVQVVVRFWELKENLLLVQLPATMEVTFIGLGISIIFGVLMAIAMTLWPKFENAIYPVIVTTQTIPTTAIAPLFVLWFGYSIWAKVLVTILITFFPIVINLHDGFKSSKREMEELMFTYGASKKDIFIKLKIPGALPNFFSALKMAIPLSIIGAAISEWLGAQEGLGYFSKRMMTQLDGAGVFAPIVLLSIVAMALVGIINILEKRFVTWRKEI
ncbi:MAG: ABC transporter permease [Anaerovoracaceae bacterium]